MRGRLTFSREGERVRATLRGGSQALIVLYNGRWAARWPGVTIVTELHCAPCILVPVGRPDRHTGDAPAAHEQEVCQVAYRYLTNHLNQ